MYTTIGEKKIEKGGTRGFEQFALKNRAHALLSCSCFGFASSFRGYLGPESSIAYVSRECSSSSSSTDMPPNMVDRSGP